MFVANDGAWETALALNLKNLSVNQGKAGVKKPGWDSSSVVSSMAKPVENLDSLRHEEEIAKRRERAEYTGKLDLSWMSMKECTLKV